MASLQRIALDFRKNPCSFGLCWPKTALVYKRDLGSRFVMMMKERPSRRQITSRTRTDTECLEKSNLDIQIERDRTLHSGTRNVELESAETQMLRLLNQ
jgi:hypothetical protein